MYQNQTFIVLQLLLLSCYEILSYVCNPISKHVRFAPISRRKTISFSGTGLDEQGSLQSSSGASDILEFQLHSSISDIAAGDWDACLTLNSSPFIKHSWLRCLEDSGCAAPDKGWVPQHISIIMDGQTKGYVPLYIKGNSLGEFIFDQQFAEAAYENGIQYYPKLLVGIPFTPATGRRILWHPSVYEQLASHPPAMKQLRRAVGQFLKQIAQSNNLSSVHINFLRDDEAMDLSGPLESDVHDGSVSNVFLNKMFGKPMKDDYLRRTSLQYHWINSNSKNDGKPFETFDDYLSCFKSKRRITIKRERSIVLNDNNIRVDAIVGKDILKHDGLVERMFEIYLSTIDKMVWGRQYLTVEFFQLLSKSDFIDNLCFMCARSQDSGEDLQADDVIAGTFNIIRDGVFYGRYWGCLPGNDIKNLHFEVCYWSAIDYCIKNGLQRMEPGAGGGDYKWARGFDPALIHSVHYICHPGLRRAVSQFLDYETENNVELTEYLLERSAVGSNRTVIA
jgi:predicted N-acyltransferase